MGRYTETRPQIKPKTQNYPERLRIVRATHATAGRVFTSANAYIVDEVHNARVVGQVRRGRGLR